MSRSATRTSEDKTELRTTEQIRTERHKLLKQMRLLYLFLLAPIALLVIFRYIPIYGVILAFKDYRVKLGITRSPWNNFEHFKMLFVNPYFGRIMRNTVIISFYRIVFGFPAPILLALLINEIGGMTAKRVIQSISYLPHFMSWVVLSGILVEVLSPQRGLLGYLYGLMGREAPSLLTSARLFRPMLIGTGIWKETGWGTVIYLAAISSIDPELYESASIDGAGRLKRVIYITLPSIIPVITILFILRVGNILEAGFDQIFNMYNPLVYEVADIIDTFVYRVGLIERKYEFSTAVGLFKNVIGVILLLSVNAIIRRFSEYGIW